MVKFKEAPQPALVVELEKLENEISGLRAENKFLWSLLGTVIFVFSLTTWVPVVF